MKVYRTAITEARPLPLNEEFAFSKEECKPLYPLLEVKKAKIEGEITRTDDILTASFHLHAEVLFSDARTAKPFVQELDADELADLLEDELGDDEDEGFILPGSYFDTKEMVRQALLPLIPIAPHAEDSPLPENGEGYSFVEEGQERTSSPFDAIPDPDEKK